MNDVEGHRDRDRDSMFIVPARPRSGFSFRAFFWLFCAGCATATVATPLLPVVTVTMTERKSDLGILNVRLCVAFGSHDYSHHRDRGKGENIEDIIIYCSEGRLEICARGQAP